LYAWEFANGNRELKVRVDGQLVFNSTNQMRNAALAGFRLAYVPEDLVQPHLNEDRLTRVLKDWCPPFFRQPPLLPQAGASPRRSKVQSRRKPSHGVAQPCLGTPSLLQRPDEAALSLNT
jgi:DNA-binding transcriptional LysR family regulator